MKAFILLAGAALLGIAGVASVAAAQGAANLDGAVKPAIEMPREVGRRTPPSVQKGFVPVQADVRLAAPDLTEVRREDQEMLEQQKMRRVGIRRELPAAVTHRRGVASHGLWTDLGDEGHIWTVTLESEEAWATRLHLEDVQIPSGARIWVYATDDPEQVLGPLPARIFRTESDHWTASIFASRVTLELELPPAADRDAVNLRVTEMVHVYVPLDELVREIRKVDTCYNDATCHPVYANEQDGIALIITVTPLGTFQCTGCMMNDYDGDTWVDYFLTANHCISGNGTNLGQQAAASTMEFYWLFQTDTCNGTPPPLGSVPRTTGGADLIHRVTASAGNDAAFVRIRNNTPGGILYMGWDTAIFPVGEDTAGLHHPDGTFSRLSFGDLSGSTANYWFNVWNNGSTEGGSSGSPLMPTGSRRVIGQLRGGLASCSNMTAHDEYGRFDVTFPNVRRWLEIGGTIHVDGSYSGVEEGTPTQPFDTVTEAHTFAWDGTRIQVEGGSYSEALTLTKQVTVIGANGTVTIGN